MTMKIERPSTSDLSTDKDLMLLANGLSIRESSSSSNSPSPSPLSTPIAERQGPTIGFVTNQRKVSFDLNDIEYLPMYCRSDLEPEDVHRLWYTKKDYAEIRRTVNATVELMRQGHTEPELYGFCYRGLEYKIDTIRRKRHDNMTRAIDSVLAIQDRLAARSTSNAYTSAHMIARVYMKHTLQCGADAYRIGLWDSKTVQALTKTSFGAGREDKAPKMPRRTWAKAG